MLQEMIQIFDVPKDRLYRLYNPFDIDIVKKNMEAEVESEDEKFLNIVLGEEFAQLLRNKASKAKVKVLYNAVGTYSYNPYNKDARNILFLGVLCERKGVYNLLQAIFDGAKLDDLSEWTDKAGLPRFCSKESSLTSQLLLV